eukprot:2344024-Pyramimonas_sp.AAC.1
MFDRWRRPLPSLTSDHGATARLRTDAQRWTTAHERYIIAAHVTKIAPDGPTKGRNPTHLYVEYAHMRPNHLRSSSSAAGATSQGPVSYTHLRAHETGAYL